jgi:hypothetical protein
MARRSLTPEQAADSRMRRAQHLEGAVRALLSSDGWARWVRVRSRKGLARYSWFNQVQIAAQRAVAHCSLKGRDGRRVQLRTTRPCGRPVEAVHGGSRRA